MDSFNELWQVVSDYLRQTNSESIYNVWFSELEPISFDGSRAVLMTTAEFKRRILAQKFGGTLHSAFLNALGLDVDVEFIAPGEGYSQSDSSGSAAGSSEIDGSTRASNYFENTFDTFVVGASNKFAHAAAQAVANDPAHAYNPLFLYGGVGLGKTHLMHAIGNRIKQNNPSMKVLYTSSEKFTNEIINSIQNKTTEAFRQKYRNIDCLIIDDIQFLKGKEQTQVEFFHTFNALKDADKQIIISSDRPPREIETLEDRLRSRFDQGLTADIQTPDLETRMAILRTKAASDNIVLPTEVITLLATNIATNIREIEGAYNKIVAYTSLMHMPITVETAQKVLSDMGNDIKTRTITYEGIIKVVADHYNVKQDELFNKKRTQNIAFPRQVAMYLCRELADLSYPRIGELFGGRDHTTVIHAYEKISNFKNSNLAFQNELQEIIEILRQ
mgnify:CR=1 FL=1